MKRSIIFKVFLITALFFLSSCKEYFITTRINSDGTIERRIIEKSDYQDSTKLPEAWQNNHDWDIKTFISTTHKDTCLVIATKKFASFGELTGETAKPKNGFQPLLDVKVEKHFRFFFTYYTYKETYKAYNIYPKIPMNKIFSEDEISRIKEGKDSAWIKQKYELYENLIYHDRIFDILEKYFYKNGDIDSPELFSKEKRMKLFTELAQSNKGKEKEDKTHTILCKYFTEKIAKKIEYVISGKDKIMTDKSTAIHDSLKEYEAPYANSVIMPGIITSSNSKTIEGNKVSWKFDHYNFEFFDYEMNAESREVNTWVIFVSGIIVLLLLVGLLLPKFRRKAAF
jgi:hypothetical protein